MTVKAKKETLDFQAEVKQLLDLVAHSLYGKKEIFLRELVSNASDAADKLRFAALSENALYEGDSELKIHIDLDEKARTIVVKDNGIGMSKDEVIENLGTIAKSGTREFIANLSGKDAQDSNLIGQFGVGFYSAFIVADKVTVKTRKAGAAADEAVCWESNGEGAYTLEAIEKPERGTEITLHLRKDEDEFLSDWRLREIVTKYSDHIGWPVVMKKKITPEVEEGQEDKKPAEPIIEEETVNRAKALWTLAKREIKAEEYREFYKHVGHDFEDPLAWSHNHVEGKQHYITLLYIPSRAPFDLWNREFQHGLKLYVKRVFIMDKADQFLPRYLRFVSGVVDSADLPLNISREILQENELVDNIRAACAKRVLSVLEKMADKEPEKYAKFWKEFGLVLKEGPIEDFANRETIAKLLRFASTQTEEETQTVSLADYLSRMQKGQEQIYYITAESFNAARHSPHLEIFRKKNIEVLLLSDPIDEWLVNHLTEFEGKKLQSVAKGELDLEGVGEEQKTEEAEKQKKQAEETFASVLEQIKEALGDRIKEVRLTDRLTTSPACVVADTQDMGREMQRILQAAGQEVPLSKPIFELNPEHPIVLKLQQETDDDRFKEWTHILFDQALLAEGGRLDDPAQFVQRLNKMLEDLC